MFVEVINEHNETREIYKQKKDFIQAKLGNLQIANWKNALKKHFEVRPNDKVCTIRETWRFTNGKIVKN